MQRLRHAGLAPVTCTMRPSVWQMSAGQQCGEWPQRQDTSPADEERCLAGTSCEQIIKQHSICNPDQAIDPALSARTKPQTSRQYMRKLKDTRWTVPTSIERIISISITS